MYTEEMTAEMLGLYAANPTRETVELLAEKYEKSVKSVIGKLSKEGVYRSEGYKTKRGTKPITKLEMATIISQKLEIDLTGLEKAPKGTLYALGEALEVEFEENSE